MILGIGVDITSVSRIEHLWQEFGDRFFEKFFTKNENEKAMKIKVEQDNFLPRLAYYAKRFAAKEAFSKACGIGIGRGINFCDIEVNNDELGKPFIAILNQKIDFLHQHFRTEKLSFHLSLSDEMPIAQAFVIIESMDK